VWKVEFWCLEYLLFPKKSNKIKKNTYKNIKDSNKIIFLFFWSDEDCTSLLRISIWKIRDNVVLYKKIVIWYYYFVFFNFLDFYVYVYFINNIKILHDKYLVIKQIRDLTWYLRWFYNFLFFVISNFLSKKELKAYKRVFWLSSKSETWHDIHNLYKIIILFIYLLLLFLEN